jgi:hypothetical protein
MAGQSDWKGRLGIEVIGQMQGCCVQSILDWRPQMLGQKMACRYCDTHMKTIRAGEIVSQLFDGGLNECNREVELPEIVIGGLHFSAKKFASTDAVRNWFSARDLGAPDEIKEDQHAFSVEIERVVPESVRAVWIAPGVIGVIGIAEKQVATGGGQASMSSPGISTISMASGGMVNPQQGPAAVVAGAPVDVPGVFHGLTEISDGHQHEYYLSSYNDPNGYRVKGYTSFNGGHTHMVEASINPDGSLDTRTAPDQAPVGGHAHAHRLISGSGMAVTAKDASSEVVNPFAQQLREVVARVYRRAEKATAPVKEQEEQASQ